ncbi:hypothetical protein DFJ58DRAFT_843305 [Suillus subalutaceus]|uniref:uncharacterized protein n=1 Tax=Suillus subalutaceus TaxID=48586 RepID=UPI001B86E1E5|nr:uncharacterized protein DFJ58DRAFT_843305 [Suillus subalutaceus]KAG1846986.1 hypothetical protein DFJ58DRAFT_843305 [Suillus subalutaceus]
MSVPTVNYPLACSHENCNMFLHNGSNASRHRHEYHTTPGLVKIGGVMYNVVWEEGCSSTYTTRSSFKRHTESSIHSQVPSSPQGEVDPVPHTGASTIPHQRRDNQDIAAGSAHALARLHQGHDTQLANSLPPVTAPLDQGNTTRRVALTAGEDYLLSSTLMDSLGIFMHTALRIFICKGCRKCLTADMVAGHRKEKHKQSLTVSQRSSLATYVEENKIYHRQEQVIIPGSGGPPVQLIASPRKAFLCLSSPDCDYVVCDKATMQKHAKNVHSQSSKDLLRCKEIHAQQLFDSVGRTYFMVDPNDSLQNKDLAKVLNDTFVPSLYVPVVQPSLSPEERRPLIKAMSWDVFMPNLRSDPAQVKAIQKLKEKHSPAECHGVLSALKDLMQAHMDMAATILDGNPHKLTLAKALLNGSNVTDKSVYWVPISDNNTSYCDTIVQFLRAIVRLRFQNDHPSKFSFQLDPAQEQTLVALITHMNDSNNSLDETAITRLHEFLWSLMNAESFHKGEPWENVIQRFIWLRALRQDGNFYEATDYTPDLAKLKYFLNSTCIVHALWYQKGDEVDELERVIAVHDEVLRVGRLTTFNMVHEYQQYASALAFGQKREPKVYVDPQFSWFSIGTETMNLSNFRQGIQILLQKVEDRYLKLTHGRIMLEDMPDGIYDDMTNTTRGHSFAMHESFHPLRLKLFCDLVEKHHLAMLDGSGVLSWDIPAVKDILRQSGEVWKPLYHLLYVTSQISTRSVQFLQHHISNADRHRNIFVEAQEVFFLSGYSKTTHITDRDSCTPAFVNPKVARWLVEFLAGGLREAESILAQVAYGDSAQHDYKTFLVLDNGSRINKDQWYAVFKQTNREVFQCAWGVRDFRQGAIAMAREFISAKHAFSLADDLLAEGADHSTEIDHSHYGNLRGSIPELSNNSVEKHRWLGKEWHSFCGLGPFEPQEPIRRTRMRGGSVQSQNSLASSSLDHPSIADAVSSATGKLVNDFLQENLPGLLRDLLTNGVVPQIVNALQSPGAPALDISQAASHIGRPMRDVTEGSRSTVQIPKQTHLHFTSEAGDQQLVDLDESGDENESQHQHEVQTGHALTARGKRARNSGPTAQSECGDDFQPPKRIRLEKSYEGGEEDAPTGTAELPDFGEGPQSASATPSFLEDLLSDQDEDEYSVLASLEEEEEDVMFDNVDYERPSQEAEADEGDMHRCFSKDDIYSWTKKVRVAFKQLFKDPTAKEKSPEQLNAIVMVMSAQSDTMVTLKTGGGKSALWMIGPFMFPDQRCIVICPFVALLEEQVERCLSAGLRAHNFTKDKNVPQDVQILFIQVESCSSKAFKELMHREEHRFHRMFVDEIQDILICHPERELPWRNLARHLSKLRIPLALLSGTNPPSNVAASLEHFSLEPNAILQIRSCTDRPEIGFHVLRVLPQAFDLSLKRIVHALQSTMSKSDRMLVFFSKNIEADAFSLHMDCAVFHSNLPTSGNTKDRNLERWDSGDTQIMACTTAFAQGVDRSSVRYVVISEVEYGLLVVNQMSGRAGRDGQEAHTFYLTRKTTLSAFEGENDHDCSKGLDDVLFHHTCRRYTSIKYMDGERRMQLFAMKAIKDAEYRDNIQFPSLSQQYPATPTEDVLVPSSSQRSLSSPASLEQEDNDIMSDNFEGQQFFSPRSISFSASPVHEATALPPLQDGEEDFFAHLPDITPDMAREMDVIEALDTLHRSSAEKVPRKDRAAKFLSSQPSLSSGGFALLPTASSHPASLPTASKKAAPPRASLPTFSKPSTGSAPPPSQSTAHKPARKMLPTRSSLSGLPKAPTASAPLVSLSAASTSARNITSPTSSLPVTSKTQPSWICRGNKVREGLEKRLQSTSLLDKYMRRLKGCCPFHFVSAEGHNRFCPEHDSACHLKGRAWDSALYNRFRRCFVFAKFGYCFKCALPQSNNHNNEAPACHSDVGYAKGDKCPFAGFIFQAVFFMWRAGYAEGLAKRYLGVQSGWGNSDEFIHWVQKEHREQGKYINLVELFLAFCKKLENAEPDIFQ